MIDIPTISIVVASASVVAGIIYYSLQIRNQTRARQTDLVVKLYSMWVSDDFLDATLKVVNLEFDDYADFVRKYGSPTQDTPVSVAFQKIANYFDMLGTLLHNRLFDANMASEFLRSSTLLMWSKMRPVVEGIRKNSGLRFSSWFEYFHNEMKKREPRPQADPSTSH